MVPFKKYTGILPLAFWSKITSGLVTFGRLLQFPIDLSIFLSKPFVSADPITNSSHVFTNPESTKPDLFSYDICRLFMICCSKWIFIKESNVLSWHQTTNLFSPNHEYFLTKFCVMIFLIDAMRFIFRHRQDLEKVSWFKFKK